MAIQTVMPVDALATLAAVVPPPALAAAFVLALPLAAFALFGVRVAR